MPAQVLEGHLEAVLALAVGETHLVRPRLIGRSMQPWHQYAVGVPCLALVRLVVRSTAPSRAAASRLDSNRRHDLSSYGPAWIIFIGSCQLGRNPWRRSIQRHSHTYSSVPCPAM